MIPLSKNSDIFNLMDTEGDEATAERFNALDTTDLQILTLDGIYDILYKATKLGFVKTTVAIFNRLDQQIAGSLSYLMQNYTWDNLLHTAVRHGRTEIVKFLLAKAPELAGQENFDGDNALSIAVNCDHPEIVKLLQVPALIPSKDSDRVRALHFAAEHGHTELVKLLLEKDLGLISSMTSDGYNALHIAAQEGHTEVIELLLEKDSGLISSMTSYGDTIMNLALDNDCFEVVIFLVAKKPVLSQQRYYEENNLLHLAAQEGCTELVELLLVKAPELIRERNIDGYNALHLAAINRRTEVVKLLLTKAPELIGETAPAMGYTGMDPEKVISILVSAFFESEIYKEDPTRRLFTFLQMLKSQKNLNVNFEKLLLPYKNDIQALVDNEKCARNKIMENGESALKLSENLGIDDYFIKTKERNFLDFIEYARSDLIALSYIQSQNILTDRDIPIEHVVADVAARYADSNYDFHPKLREKMPALTEPKEWRLDESPFQELTQEKLKNIGLFLDYALELEMSLVRPEVQSDWAKESLNSKPQKRITDFFCSDGNTQKEKREREDEDFAQVGRECKRRKVVTAQGPSRSSSFFETELTEDEMQLCEKGKRLINQIWGNESNDVLVAEIEKLKSKRGPDLDTYVQSLCRCLEDKKSHNPLPK